MYLLYLVIERNQIDLIQPSQVKHILESCITDTHIDDSIPIYYTFLAQLFSCSYPFWNFIEMPAICSCRKRYVVVRRYICLFSWIGLVTSPNGNQVEWMCNGKKNFSIFVSFGMSVSMDRFSFTFYDCVYINR